MKTRPFYWIVLDAVSFQPLNCVYGPRLFNTRKDAKEYWSITRPILIRKVRLEPMQ